jgi:hypothetical protein
MVFIVGKTDKREEAPAPAPAPDSSSPSSNLSKQKKAFVAEVIRTGSAELAAKEVYGEKKIGRELMRDPTVQMAVTAILDTEGLDDKFLVTKIKSLLGTTPGKVEWDNILRAIEMIFNLKGSFAPKKIDATVKSQNFNMYMELSPEDLKKKLIELLGDK